MEVISLGAELTGRKLAGYGVAVCWVRCFNVGHILSTYCLAAAAAAAVAAAALLLPL